MAQDAPRRRRARPVADAPVPALLPRAEQIAKGWVLALVEDAPLHAAPGILGSGVVADGPRLCDAAVRALASDEALAQLSPGGTLRATAAAVGMMTGAAGPGGALHAVDVLSDVLWAAICDELRGPAADLVTDLAQRLALVCAVLREAATDGVKDGAAAAGTQSPPPPAPDPWATGPPAGGDDWATGPPPPATDPWATGPPPPATDPWATEPPPAATGVGRDAPLWIGALADEVAAAIGDGRALSLLLAELEDADRVIAAATPERATAAVEEFVRAVRGALRHDDVLVHEADGRAWVIARATARPAAHSLGARIAEAVGRSPSRHGAPLVASVGIAVLGEDGRSGEELVDAAEQARFSASARGIEVSRRVPDGERR